MPPISRPATLKGKLAFSASMLLASMVLGLAAGTLFYQANRETIRSSTVIGHMICGEGQHVDDVPAGRRAMRMICRDANNIEVSPRNNLVMVKLSLPFIIVLGIAFQIMAWLIGFRESER